VGTSYVLDIDNSDENLIILGHPKIDPGLVIAASDPFPFGIYKGASISFKLYTKNVFKITSCSIMLNLKMTELKFNNYKSILSASPITIGVAKSNDVDPVLMGKVVTCNGLPIIMESGKFINSGEWDVKVGINKQQIKMLNAIVKNYNDEKGETLRTKRPYDSKSRIDVSMRERTQIGYLIDDRVDNTNDYSSKFHRVLLHGAEISIEISIRMDRSNNHKYGQCYTLIWLR